MKTHLGNVPASHLAYTLSQQAAQYQGLTLIIAETVQQADMLYQHIPFFLDNDDQTPCYYLPDWETLPYDHFSPENNLVSTRLNILRKLPTLSHGLLVTSIQNLINPIPPKAFIDQHSVLLAVGQSINLTQYRQELEALGYQYTSQVRQTGEFTVRGSILDLFPTGAKYPYRVDLFDETIDSIRPFDPDTQKSTGQIERIDILPAHEFPLTKAGYDQFATGWQQHFADLRPDHPVLDAIKRQRSYQGIEYYMPLFFDSPGQLTDYLCNTCQVLLTDGVQQACQDYWQLIEGRYEQNRYNLDRPCLPPTVVFHRPEKIWQTLKPLQQLKIHTKPLDKTNVHRQNLDIIQTTLFNDMCGNTEQRLKICQSFLQQTSNRILFIVESAGRREVLLEKLQTIGVKPTLQNSLFGFISDQNNQYGIVISPFPHSINLNKYSITLINENLFLSDPRAPQNKPSSTQTTHTPQIPIYDLTELQPGYAVVHLEHGVGRYQGLTHITVQDRPQEFLTIAFANDDILYVPVHNLHLVSRYSATEFSNAPIHKLGSDQWEKTKQKAAKHLHDVAAELLDIQARRQASAGFSYQISAQDCQQFADSFPFEETDDQRQAIKAILEDMQSPQAMDRLLCGDVGFGKTEVAMRASFLAAHNHKQVAILVPTTLLAQQHYENFRDRFADYPVEIEMLSRFRTQAESTKIHQKLANHQVDIVIGTHQLLSKKIQFADLGLLIIDEEHRFGVRQKEKIKSLRSHVDILSMTATPIPRTLNMSLSTLRDLSIIATPPIKRLSVKTFVHEFSHAIIQEAISREIARGGQVFFLHNDVQTIEKTANLIQEIAPNISIAIAHGQMRERELEKTMGDFYHNRQQVLVCSTIIETGIDIPNANTIIIHHADRFGLAQLHQLRGRVGRSHHQAYAYLLSPPIETLTKDAQRRLEAIVEADQLGAGFMLANHDLEIRGAGEILGEEQSGNLHNIGFGLYLDILEKTVKAIKTGKTLDINDNFTAIGCDIDLPVIALIPEDYLPDVQMRLQCYKRLSTCTSKAELEQIQIDMIDRFGLLPDPIKNLIAKTELRLLADKLGIIKIRIHGDRGTLYFSEDPSINFSALIRLIQLKPKQFQLKGEQQLNFQCDTDDGSEYFTTIKSILSQLR